MINIKDDIFYFKPSFLTDILFILIIQLYELPSARVVVAVTLDGSARKLVTIRSALILANQLHYPVDVKLENVALRLGGMSHKNVVCSFLSINFQITISIFCCHFLILVLFLFSSILLVIIPPRKRKVRFI